MAMKTISDVFEEFLGEQKSRLSRTSFLKYQDTIALFEGYLESYWPIHNGKEYSRITGQGGTFCGTFGPEEIPGGYGEFLGYYMGHKVMGGEETMKAAGTVTTTLAKWLAEKGYVKNTEDAQKRAKRATKDLPAAQDLLDLLEEFVAINAPDAYTNEIEDHFWIRKIEPGKLRLEPLTTLDKMVGPVPAPEAITQVCREMWDIGGIVAKTRRGWRFLEVWSVTP